MTRSNRNVFLFIIMVMVAGIIVGCSKEGANTNTVTIWTLWSTETADINAKAFHRILETSKTEFPDIVIEHDSAENEAYKTKIKTAMGADDAPDIFFAWGAGFLRPFVEGGKVEALDSYMQDGTMERMKQGSNTNFIFDGKLYGLTFTQWVASFYCNAALFDENGIKIPDTYEELLAAVEGFRMNDIIPISVGEKDRWPGIFWQNSFAIRTAGAGASNAALNGNGSFDTPEFVRSAALLDQLVKADAFAEGAMGLNNDDANALYLNRQAAMYYMGSWFAGDIANAEDPALIEDTIVKHFPLIRDAKGGRTEFLGGAIDGMSVSSGSKNKESAVAVVKYLMEGTARDLASTGGGLPTWTTDDVVTENPNPVTEQIKDMIADSTGYVLAWDTFLVGADADDHKNYVAEIFGGQTTPEEFAQKMEALNK